MKSEAELIKSRDDADLILSLESACYPAERLDTAAERAAAQERIDLLWAEVKRRGLRREQIERLRIGRGPLRLHNRR